MADASASTYRLSEPSGGPPPAPSARPGLRLQIVLALAGLMLLAFVPLFVAVASLARATVFSAREQAGRTLGRALAAHVSDANASGDSHALTRALEAHARAGDVDAVCVFGADGSRKACAGSAIDTMAMQAPFGEASETASVLRAAGGYALEIVSPLGDGAVVARVHAADGVDGSKSLVRLVALYMVTFALALLVFAYFVLTRLIVMPIEGLVDAADRVASGARTLSVPRVGAREFAELAASVHAMAQKLISEEAALIIKVDELTETTSWLKDTQNQLVGSERLASVGRLVAGFAHEVGNPLAALLGFEELLLAGDVTQEEQTDYLRRMRRETERIHNVVRDLLDFARPEHNVPGGDTPPSAAQVRAVVQDVVALVSRQPAFRSILVDTLVEDSVRVLFPEARLAQVMLNMVLNAGAAIASGKGSGRIVIRAQNVDGGSVRIEIEDDGPGVSRDVRDRLFEPFVTTKEVGQGTGLGLAVCRGLVNSAGGDVGLDLSHPTGARFYVLLPSAPG